MYTVYKHTSPSNKVYIGITSRDVRLRWGYGYGYQSNSHFWKAIQKYGWNNFKHEIVATNLTKVAACELERQLIKQYSSNHPNFGYNLSSGGELSGIGVKCSDEKKQKISESRLGEKHWFYGKHLSEDHRKKISNALKGKTYIPNTINKYKEAATRLRGKPVRCVETNVRYRSVVEASEKTNICRSGISQVLIGKHKTAGGYHWEYVT